MAKADGTVRERPIPSNRIIIEAVEDADDDDSSSSKVSKLFFF